MLWQATGRRAESGDEINGLDGILRLRPEKTAEITRGFLSQSPTSLILGVRINFWAVIMWHDQICLFLYLPIFLRA
jgi:hypothetical protein